MQQDLNTILGDMIGASSDKEFILFACYLSENNHNISTCITLHFTLVQLKYRKNRKTLNIINNKQKNVRN